MLKKICKIIFAYMFVINVHAKLSQKNIDKILRRISKETKCRIFVTSGYRTKKHNKEVGGAKKSWHLKDRARDFYVKGKGCTLKYVAKVACKYLTTIRYPKHIHTDDRPNKKCWTSKYKR